MESAMSGSLGFQFLARNPAQSTVKLGSFNERWRDTSLNMKIPKSKQFPGVNLVSKHEKEECEELRSSPNQIGTEISQCYELIKRLGRGVVYLGSSRTKPDHSHYIQAFELSREIAYLLDCTSWTGAGPGLMDAASQGALKAGKLVGGLKIGREAGQWTASEFHSYLPSETYHTCRFFSARKHGLVDAAMRSCSSDRTAMVALPGGTGTLDEIFEIFSLIQLNRIGSNFPVPFLLMNYDSYYSKLLDFLHDCVSWGNLAENELESMWKVCESNSEALTYLAEFYDISLRNKGIYQLFGSMPCSDSKLIVLRIMLDEAIAEDICLSRLGFNASSSFPKTPSM